jgi:phosphohistidine phosphatase
VILTLLRHAIPLDPSRWSGDDASRPLTDPGRAQLHKVLEALLKSGRLEFDAIWCSPYLRTRETAELAGKLLGIIPMQSPALISGSKIIESLPKIHGAHPSWPSRLLLVGHQPDLGDLVTDLVGHSSSSFGLGRAGSAKLEGEFKRGGMKLHWLLTAEQAIQPPPTPP